MPLRAYFLLAFWILGTSLAVHAGEGVATVKTLRGEAWVERGEQTLPLSVGMPLFEADVVATGARGAAGITFEDDSLISLGAGSRLLIDQFSFDPDSQSGEFQATLARGRIAVVSGRIAKSKIDAMKVRTPSALLGVRGTEFLVETRS